MVETSETADGPRRRQLGKGMVQAADGGALRIGSEVIGPRERLAVDHPLVRAHPEKFVPVLGDDVDCRERMLRLLKTREAALTGRTGAVPTPSSASRGPLAGQAPAPRRPPGAGAGTGVLNLPAPRRPLRLP
jgi:hypothetical protein